VPRQFGARQNDPDIDIALIEIPVEVGSGKPHLHVREAALEIMPAAESAISAQL